MNVAWLKEDELRRKPKEEKVGIKNHDNRTTSEEENI
jgi:hypothetical protein